MPPELLGAAQQSWDEAVELGETLRRAQLAGQRARADRHHRPDDGLRHHRHRARPRAHEGEEARRWRHDVHRQPDDPACAAQPRLLRRARSTRSSPTSTSTRRSSVRRAFKAEHLPVFACSMGDNTIHYMGHVKMMGRCSRSSRGAISKTVNMPEEVTVEDVEELLPRGVAARPQGRRALPRQLQGRPAARPRRRRPARPAPSAAEHAEVERIVEHVIVQEPVRQKLPRMRNVEDVLVPGRRLPRLRDRRRVRGRPSRRGVPQGREAGLDARRDHGRVRDLGEPRPAVRRAARGVRRDVHEHALRARGHDRRPRHPVRDEPRRLHLPPARGGVPRRTRSARRHGHPHGGGARCSRRCPGVEEAATPSETVVATSRPRTGRRRRRCITPAPDAAAHPGHARAAREREIGALPRLRRHHAARRLLPRLPELRRTSGCS